MKLTKRLMALGVITILLAGCGTSIPVKDHDDRKHLMEQEIDVVRETVSKMKGVKNVEIHLTEDDVYASIEVTDKKHAKKVAIVAFKSLVAETIYSVDVFVKEGDDMLIQAFKKSGTDDENNWDILY